MMFFALLLVVSTWQTVLGQCLTENDGRDDHDPEAQRDLLHSQLNFSLNLLKAVSSLQPDENVFISPLSVYKSLLLAFFVSGNHTEASLRKTLLLPEDQDKLDLMLCYRLEKVRASSAKYKSQAHTADQLFISANQTVRDCMYELFHGEFQTLNFSKTNLEHAVDNINGWVTKQTDNLIKDLVTVDSISPSTELILASVGYFKGIWQHEFAENETTLDKFYVTETKPTDVPMMHQRNNFSHWHSDKLQAEVLDMPYKGGNISMIILLPDKSNTALSPAELLKHLDSDTLRNIIHEASQPTNHNEVDVKLPKFTLERTLELTPVLEGMGVGDLFKPTSNLTRLTGGPSVQLNSAIHKAKIQLVEKGVESAPVMDHTGTHVSNNTFFCDRPFSYLLYDKELETLLFAGIYNDPNK